MSRDEITALAARRRDAVKQMRDAGMTLDVIAAKLGVSRERVRQILRSWEFHDRARRREGPR